MTQIIEPNEKSDLKQESVRRWVSQAFTGILSGLDVTPGSTGFTTTIASGEAWINSVHVDDDETRIDLSLLTTIGPAGADEHWIIYGSHTPAATFPPPPMTISAAMATPPAVPVLPADSVKLADVFVPTGANDINDCTIVKAPKLPDRGSNDADVVVERLINSNMNVLFGGGGSFTHNGTDTLTWTSDIDLIATTITNKEKFASVPLAAYRIAAGSLGPSPVVGPNSILFAVMDRTSPVDPSTPTVTTMRVLNLDAPDATEANAFYDPVREKIVFIGAIIGGVLKFRSGISSSLPAPVAQTNYFLRNDPGGAHFWSAITSDLIVDILSITSLVASPNVVELGDDVGIGAVEHGALNFTAAYAQGPPTTTALSNDENANVDDPLAQDPGVGETFAYQGAILQELGTGANGQVVFTLQADAGDTPDTRQETLDWYRRTYYGVNASDPGAGNYDNTFLKTTLGNNQLRSGKGITINLNPTNEYVFFAYPAWKGAVSSIIDNNTSFDVTGAFTQVDPAQVGITTENAAAIAENYRVYRSVNLQNGNVNITVS